MNRTPNQQTNEQASMGGVLVPMEAYEHHQREISKLAKERDEAASKRDIYKYLCIGLAATIIIAIFLNSCLPIHLK